MPLATPRFVTARNPDRLTVGQEVVEIAKRLGFTPMPWQAESWMTQYELDDDGSLWYRESRKGVPRQSGKTTDILARQVHRMIRSEALGWGKRPVGAYTAQHASDAREKMRYTWMPVVQFSGLLYTNEVSRFYLPNGKESIEWRSGGRMVTFPPNGIGAHGPTLDLVDIDEAFAFPDNRAEQGARHAMITRPSPQICITSTAGTNESVYLRGKVDDGRQRVKSGLDGHVYYLEYSAGPDDDIHNPLHWPRWMPALRTEDNPLGTIEMKNLLIEHDTLDEDEWARAYCNMWTGSLSSVYPAVAWAAAFTPRVERSGRVWLAVDVAPGTGGAGRAASISEAHWQGNEVIVQVLANGAGTSWVADKVGELTRQTVVTSVTLDAVGGAAAILDDIKAKSAANVEVIDTQTMLNAHARFHQAVIDKSVRHYDQAELNAAVEGAAKRVVNDGWALKRRTSTANIAPLVSCVLAHWSAATHPKQGLITMFINPGAVR